MSSLMFYCLKVLISTIFEKRLTDGPTDRPTDGRTDKASFRDAWTYLKTALDALKGTMLHFTRIWTASILRRSNN